MDDSTFYCVDACSNKIYELDNVKYCGPSCPTVAPYYYETDKTCYFNCPLTTYKNFIYNENESYEYKCLANSKLCQ